MIFRAIVIWVLLLGVAVLNGTAREFLLAPRLEAQAGHVASTMILCAAIFIVALAFTRWMGPRSRGGAMLIGAVWLALTLAFEFLAGHYLFGSSWERLFAEYDLLRGRVWILVLVATLFAPAWALGWSRASK
jgi:hypothetical protein